MSTTSARIMEGSPATTAVFVVAVVLLWAAEAAAAPANTVGDLSGVWWSTQNTPAIHPTDGMPIPFTPVGQAAYAADKPLIKEIESKPPSLHDMRRCLPAGVPREWGTGYPFQIMQRPNEVVIAFEHDHMRRFVYLDERLDLDAADPAYMGNSVGHWDGGTLVIDSGAYKLHTFVDDTGLPHGENLKVTERIRKLPDGKTLEVLATINDPEMYTRPWTARYTFTLRPNERIQEYTCGIGVIQSRFGTIGEMPKLQHHGS